MQVNDRAQLLVDAGYGAGGRVTCNVLPAPDAYASTNNDWCKTQDVEGAKALLAEAGWKDSNSDGTLDRMIDGERVDFEFTIITNNGNDLRKAILAIAQDAWKQIGIDVHTDLLEWSVFIQERVNKLDFDALILGWSMGIDPDL